MDIECAAGEIAAVVSFWSVAVLQLVLVCDGFL